MTGGGDGVRREVVLGDIEAWSALLDLGAALRGRGLSVRRVTAVPRSRRDELRNRLQRIVFHAVDARVVECRGEIVDVDPVVGVLSGPVIAVEAEDRVGAAFTRHEVWATRPGLWRTPDLAREALLYDKLAMTRLAERTGVPAPRTWSRREEIDGPFPVVVKSRLGAGGRNVRVVRDAQECERVWGELGERADDVFAQEFIAGDVVHAGGIARHGEIVQACVYRSAPAPSSPLGPPMFLTVLDAPEVLAQAAILLQEIGYTGAFCIDYVRAPGGPPMVIDLNPRIFGSWMALQQAGLDLVGSWLYAQGLGPRPRDGVARPGFRGVITPANVALGNPGPLRARVGASLAAIPGKARYLGARWTVLAVLELALSTALEIARRIHPLSQRRTALRRRREHSK